MLPVLLAIFGCSMQFPVTVYVSPLGSDGSNGSAQSPVASLGKALEVLREKRSKASGAAVIELAAGDYPISQSIRLGPADGNLVIQGRPGARLFAGTILSGWTLLTDPTVLARLPSGARGNVLTCDVSNDSNLSQEKPGDDITHFDLLVDHLPMQLARWPEEGAFLLTGANPSAGASPGGAARVNGAGPVGGGIQPQTFEFPSDRVSKWDLSRDIWGLGYWNHDYVSEVRRLQFSGNQISLVGKTDAGVAPNRRFFFLNVLEELSSPGEYYFDRATHRVYLYPPAGSSGREVAIERMKDPELVVSGASHVTVTGLTFEGGRGDAATILGGDHVVFTNCAVRGFGGSGLYFKDSYESGVSHCTLEGLGSSGISLEAGDRKTLSPGGDFADDNRISRYARWDRTYRPAILLSGVAGRASHNEIHDAPHNAILLSGNDHLVEYNDIYKVCTEAGDAGAVYEGRDPSYRGLVVQFNRFRDIKPTYGREHEFLDVVSVYLDDRLCGAKVFGNVFEGPGMGVLVGGGRDNQVENNLFVDKTIAVRFDQRGKTWQAGAAVDHYVEKAKEALSWSPTYGQRYPELASILTDDPAAARHDVVSNNVSVGATETFLHLEDGLVPNQVGNQNNVVLSFGTLEDAIAHEPKGFPEIPIRSIGPRAEDNQRR